jgi:hypothetical protein
MLTIVLANVLFGAALGLRFRIYALLPAVGLAVVLVAADGVLNRSPLFVVTGGLILSVIALQIGYLLGILIRGHWAVPPILIRGDARAASLRKSRPSLADS